MGINTSTFGMGASYNEDLLQAMAVSGNGNYYYLADEKDFANVFTQELNDLQNITLEDVVLKIEGVTVIQQLNNFPAMSGGWTLPHLTQHRELSVVCKISWDSKILPEITATITGTTKENHGSVAQTISFNQILVEGKADPTAYLVAQKFEFSKQRQDVVKLLDQKNFGGARDLLRTASLNAATLGLSEEVKSFGALSATLDAGDMQTLRKSASYGSYQTNYGRTNLKDSK